MHTAEVVELCGHARFDVVIVETVGLGQVKFARFFLFNPPPPPSSPFEILFFFCLKSEVSVLDAVDCVLLLLPPAAGDELQVKPCRFLMSACENE